jgi:L,D-peptidoglycan transpeptidase YkuD (ErfK/YbiS/YcfS/YnhG family)
MKSPIYPTVVLLRYTWFNMKKIIFSFLLFLISCSHEKAINQKNLCQELKSTYAGLGSPNKSIVVTSPNTISPFAKLSMWIKDSSGVWKKSTEDFNVHIGKNGMGLGYGATHYNIDRQYPIKKEGDGKTPMGQFLLGKKFGKKTAAHFKQTENYFEINQGTECVDDVNSPYYNRIVETTEGSLLVEKNWKSSEIMMKEPLYEQGIVVNYQSNAEKKAGSCIFMHLKDEKKVGTSGCIAMEKNILDKVFEFAKNLEPVMLVTTTQEFFEKNQSCILVD